MRHYLLVLMMLAAACGDDDKDEGYSEACEDAMKPEVQAQMDQAQIDNTAARDAAVAAEKVRLGVESLRPTTILGTTSSHAAFKPEVDPFPKSIVVSGNLASDIRANGYEMNHGMMEMLNIYETAPDSGEYFIVDLIDGDGLGGNGREVNAYEIEYGLSESIPGLEGNSWHSWHISKDNVLVRATQKPQDNILGEVSICGCGPYYEVEANLNLDAASKAPVETPIRSVAIFMLTGKGVPKIGTDVFEARFTRSYFKQKYVPRKGHHCRESNSNVVC